jgi:chemotaxis protein MotB
MIGDNQVQEIIIVKRGQIGDDGHHGGAWKIAFADFMTAMMALFLVLWLINAANEETKKSVASYFNPVKLVDRHRSERGLDDSDGIQDIKIERQNGDHPAVMIKEDATAHDEPVADETGRPVAEGHDKPADQEFFANPDAILAAIAGNDEEASPGTGTSGGRDLGDFVDPFSQQFWAEAVDALPDAADRGDDAVAETAAPAAPSAIDDVIEPAVAKAAVAPEAAADKTAEVEAAVRDEIAQTLAAGGLEADQVSVVRRDDGILISLTDSLRVSMFGVGSAVPGKPLVDAVGAIGAVLQKQSGAISIIGHTDTRPYASGSYDNWQLSTARAQATLYMLRRGGLDETRVKSVSGMASGALLDQADGYAPVNRRIEILLQVAS